MNDIISPSDNTNQTKPPIIVICGPTACGKTAAAIKLAKRIKGEVISADSMQVYKYMDIGTAKPTAAEMEGVPHHMIDVLYPNEPFSAAVFQTMAKDCIQQVYNKGKMPILVGGTGFYINALLKDNDFTQTDTATAYRKGYYALASRFGSGYVHRLLKDVDPVSYANIHRNNLKRVVRALEYFHLTGEPISKHNAREKEKKFAFDTRIFVLHSSREEMYTRIEQRVDKMIEAGLPEEVKMLLNMGYGPELVSMQGLGYKELVPVITGNMPLAEAVYTLKRNTRRFAKRQLTWFRNQTTGTWIEMGTEILI